MRTLYLMRHAKSNWDASYVGDYERPLSVRGKKAARLIGKFLGRTAQIPTLIICSSAIRTQQTLEIASKEGGWGDVETVIENELYLTTKNSIMGRICSLSNEIESVMLLGHEPTTSVVAGSLIGGGSLRFPTGACARIDMNIDNWADIHPGSGTLQWLITPKMLNRKK